MIYGPMIEDECEKIGVTICGSESGHESQTDTS